MYKELCLKNNNYSMIILKNNIYLWSLIEILKTQHLTKEFIIHYILNKDYQLTKEENEITIDMVLYWQKHIKKNDLLNLHLDNKRKDSFSFEDYL